MDPTTLPAEIAAELEKLRDIRLPDPIGWWPFAPTVWVLFAVSGILALCVIGWLARRRRSLRYRALKELHTLASTQDLDAGTLAEQIEILLKRLARQLEPRLAASHGDDWIGQLAAGDAGMSDDIARALASAPYLPAGRVTVDRGRLIEAARRWIRSHT